MDENEVTLEEKEHYVRTIGHNFGEIELKGQGLSFILDSRKAFNIPLKTVSKVKLQGETDVNLEFYEDDTNAKDSLEGLTFHVPTSNRQFIGDGIQTPAEVLSKKISLIAPVATSKDYPMATFDVLLFFQKKRYTMELYDSFFQITALDIKISYSEVVGFFLLPKINDNSCIVISCHHILRGKDHLIFQFEKHLSIWKDLLDESYRDKLPLSYKEHIDEDFIKVFCDLSGSEVIRPDTFRDSKGDYSVSSTLGSKIRLLYPFEKGLFFLQKKPIFILQDEIVDIVFQYCGAKSSRISSDYFDILLKFKNGQEHLFQKIETNEYNNLYNYLCLKGYVECIRNLLDSQPKEATEKVALNLEKWLEFKLQETAMVNHNTNLYRFSFDPTAKLGLDVASCVITRAAIGDESMGRKKYVTQQYTPILDPDSKGYFDLLIKINPEDKMSQHFAHLKPGDMMEIKGCRPIEKLRYSPNMKKKMGMIASGIGITPMLQVIKAILKNPDDSTQVSLLYANVSPDDILLKAELDELATIYPNFKVFYTVEHAFMTWRGGVGLSKDMILKGLPGPSEDALILVCGPHGMMNNIPGEKRKECKLSELLKDLRYKEKMVYKF